jgi:hypothetical protein
MNKFKVGQEVSGTHPALGGTAMGTVLMNDLRGQYPVLTKFNVGGQDICVQTDAQGSGYVKPLPDKPKTESVIAYLFADGKATPWLPAHSPIKGEKVAVGAMHAKRLENGSYVDHRYTSLVDDSTDEAPRDMPVAKGWQVPEGKAFDMDGMKPPEGYQEFIWRPGMPIPDDLRDILDQIFGGKDQTKH